MSQPVRPGGGRRGGGGCAGVGKARLQMARRRCHGGVQRVTKELGRDEAMRGTKREFRAGCTRVRSVCRAPYDTNLPGSPGFGLRCPGLGRGCTRIGIGIAAPTSTLCSEITAAAAAVLAGAIRAERRLRNTLNRLDTAGDEGGGDAHVQRFGIRPGPPVSPAGNILNMD